MNPSETAIRRIIYRRITGYEFVTDSGIRIPLNLKELDRKIIEEYPFNPIIDDIIKDLEDLELNQTTLAARSNISGAMDLSEMPDPKRSIFEIHKRIKGTDYYAPELYGLPIPIDRTDWDRRHSKLQKLKD